jgi:hypothetical protein
MTAAHGTVSIGQLAELWHHTILNLSNTGLDIVQAQVGRSLPQACEIHVWLEEDYGRWRVLGNTSCRVGSWSLMAIEIAITLRRLGRTDHVTQRLHDRMDFGRRTGKEDIEATSYKP